MAYSEPSAPSPNELRPRTRDARGRDPCVAPPRRRDQGAHLARAEVAVDVAVEERAQPRVADDVAADDRAGRAGDAVDLDRLHGLARGRGMRARERGEALEVVPAEVGAVGRRQRQVVDLLEAVLADVADRDPRLARIGDEVEGEAVRVAQAAGSRSSTGAGRRGSIRSSLPSREFGFCALSAWSPAPPPSPVPA